MNAVAVRTEFRQGTDAWREARRSGIGSSDIPVIARERGSVVELWAEKTGRAEPAVDEKTERLFRWGHLLEDAIATGYTEETGRPLRQVNRMLARRDIPWAFASIDRESARRGERRAVEIKNTRSPRWATTEGVPGDVEAQIQWQMWVGGYDVADVVVLRFGSDLAVHERPRNDRLIDDLLYLARDFRDHVVTDTAPTPDGSEQTREALARIWRESNGLLLPGTAETDELVAQVPDAVEAAKSAKEHEGALKNALRALIGEADGIRRPGVYRVTWTRNKPSEVIDHEGIARDLDRLVDKVHEWLLGNEDVTREELLLATEQWALGGIHSLHTTTKPGPRVLRFTYGEKA